MSTYDDNPPSALKALQSALWPRSESSAKIVRKVITPGHLERRKTTWCVLQAVVETHSGVVKIVSTFPGWE